MKKCDCACRNQSSKRVWESGSRLSQSIPHNKTHSHPRHIRSRRCIQFLFLLHPARCVHHKKAAAALEELIGRGNQEAEGVAIAPRGGVCVCGMQMCARICITLTQCTRPAPPPPFPRDTFLCRGSQCVAESIVCVWRVCVLRRQPSSSANWPRSGSSQ